MLKTREQLMLQFLLSMPKATKKLQEVQMSQKIQWYNNLHVLDDKINNKHYKRPYENISTKRIGVVIWASLAQVIYYMEFKEIGIIIGEIMANIHFNFLYITYFNWILLSKRVFLFIGKRLGARAAWL